MLIAGYVMYGTVHRSVRGLLVLHAHVGWDSVIKESR
jgi:hypothetical protein